MKGSNTLHAFLPFFFFDITLLLMRTYKVGRPMCSLFPDAKTGFQKCAFNEIFINVKHVDIFMADNYI